MGEGLVCQILVRPDGVTPKGRHVAGVEQRVRGWLGQVAQIAVPGVSEVDQVARFLDHPDDERPVLERSHVRRGVATTEELSDPLESVEVEGLAGQKDDEVGGQRVAQRVELLRSLDAAQVDPLDEGAQGARGRKDRQRRHRVPDADRGRPRADRRRWSRLVHMVTRPVRASTLAV